MFLKLFEPIFAALKKDLKIGLISILIVVCIVVVVYSEKRIDEARDDCVEERRADKATIAAKDSELREYRIELQKYLFEELRLSKQTQQNDSIIREAATKDINKIMP